MITIPGLFLTLSTLTPIWNGLLSFFPLSKSYPGFTHSSILAWKIPWTKEPGKLQFTGLKESDLATKPPPTQVSRLMTSGKSFDHFNP